MELSGAKARTDLRSFLISAKSSMMAEASVIAPCVAFDFLSHIDIALTLGALAILKPICCS